ncbi:phosphotyrosine-specific ptp2-like protein [Conoideocrella luteorostrata]|uniref:protein-tyrosine-phosphatase n=1 Tax=Conoideocrella luteorostrata TaxID=1105319 RepID=A0AAJ0CKP1_9HYPO|nr:phosphotyrosine-specific ptp2-like protein [Conoideocrella luteorostrata]
MLPSGPKEEGGRAPSPNYFGLVMESGHESRDSSGLANHNWSPSSSVKSFAAAIPKQITLDPNPEYEAFKKAADLNRGKSASLATSHGMPQTSQPAPIRPRPPRWHTFTSDTGSENYFPKSVSSLKGRSIVKNDADRDSLHDSAYVSSDSKRNSESSLQPAQITGTMPFESPSLIETPVRLTPLQLPRHAGNGSCLSLNLPKVDRPSSIQVNDLSRAATLPSKLDPAMPSIIAGEELKCLIETSGLDKLLLLDIRSSQSFAQSHIGGALNLCIPTTLLKRATFNIPKLQQTFQSDQSSEQFSKWSEMEWIVVYDANTSDQRDAATAQNMIKKFTNEGFSGKTAILRGGFSMFSTSFPELVDRGSNSQTPIKNNRTSTSGSNIAPVIGGVNLPTASNDHNPFFSNIRQNMDLVDGVGQFDISRPHDLNSPLLPAWIRHASAGADHGKKVSDKFLNIELDEQSRMRTAYAAFNPNQTQSCKFQLSGVEKGVKNRYKDILPFEHARVRLQEPNNGSCDYVNASHLSSSRSNKRYIASQGPLPATFEDFWSVIWEQDVRVIVMLTAESEGGQLKCHPYWKGRDFGSIKLKALSETRASLDIDKHRSESNSTPSSSTSHEFGRRRANTTSGSQPSADGTPGPSDSNIAPYVTIRKFALSHAAHPFAPIREITHLHFSSWPDFGTPAQPSHLLALVELANVMQRATMPVETSPIIGSSKVPSIDPVPVTWYDEPEQDPHPRPMLVHCSAGCGRTGAFCTVDSVIDMLKRRRQVEIATSRARDADGDVSMDISPMTKFGPAFQGFFDRGTGGHNFHTWQSSGIDTNWLQDEDVDLIQKTVQDFREQRLSMVQTLRQYVLCYETILEWFHRMQDKEMNSASCRARSGSLQQARR